MRFLLKNLSKEEILLENSFQKSIMVAFLINSSIESKNRCHVPWDINEKDKNRNLYILIDYLTCSLCINYQMSSNDFD